jgi:hypothetical protein
MREGPTSRSSSPQIAPLLCLGILCAGALIESACGTTSGSATNPTEPGITVTVSPASASVAAGGGQVFTATVAGANSGGMGVTWSVNGISDGNSTVGTVSPTSATTALYTAPSAPPSPATVTVTATSTGDPAESGSATVTVTCSATDAISPPSARVGLGQAQTFTASFCLAAGETIAWDVNGIAGGNSTVGTVAITGSSSALYTAPADLPSADPVTVRATVDSPDGGSSAIETASASVTIASSVAVSISPAAAGLAPGEGASFTPAVSGTPDTTVSWSVNGIPNGNGIVGQVCESGVNPCTPPSAPGAGSIEYIAPISAPAANTVALVATSHADPSRTGSAIITISGASAAVAIAIAPPYAFIPASGLTPSQLQFAAVVTGTANTGVTWSAQSGVAGQGCAGAACGTVGASGLYSAPAAAPSPNAISVTATSVADPTKSASATIALTNGPVIETILPSSVMAGAVEGFPLSVEGANFTAGSGSSASTILINGAARSTTCASTAECAIALNPSDVQSAGTLTVQVQNPGTPASLSNPVPLVIVPFDVSVGTISLSSTQPVAASQDIIVVEPTTAAESSPINVDFIGLLTGGNTCGVQGSPLSVTRPSSGSAVVSICVHGNGLDPTFAYAFTGPSAAPGGSDIGVTASAVAGLFPNMIELDLQLASTTLPGVRTLFITTPNNDRAVATGMLEVE